MKNTKLILVFSLLLGLSSVYASASFEKRKFSVIQLPKDGYIQLDVIDSYKLHRKFLVTCDWIVNDAEAQKILHSGIETLPVDPKKPLILRDYSKVPIMEYKVECQVK